MASDTRDKNIYYNLNNYFYEYTTALNNHMRMVDANEIKRAVRTLKDCKNKRRVFVAGNGGSSAIAEHLTCDIEKGCHVKSGSIPTHCLSNNTALMTAVGNDLGYEHTFSYQLKTQNLTSEDVVILISSSGNSPNIINAAKLVNERFATLIGLTGFDGGELRLRSSIKLHVPAHNYGIVEDAHQAIMHVIAQMIFMETR